MDVFVGRITSTGFSTGDRFVIGDWGESPLGSFTNVMWAKPNGSRFLLSPSEKHAEYVSKLYNFEDVEVTEITVEREEGSHNRGRWTVNQNRLGSPVPNPLLEATLVHC